MANGVDLISNCLVYTLYSSDYTLHYVAFELNQHSLLRPVCPNVNTVNKTMKNSLFSVAVYDVSKTY